MFIFIFVLPSKIETKSITRFNFKNIENTNSRFVES